MASDQTGVTRRALAAMYPAAWDDPYLAFCDACGAECDPTEAHSPHLDDCPQRRIGADVCRCDTTVCPDCCWSCETLPSTRALIVLLVAVLVAALLSVALQPDLPTRGDCPDANGACVYNGTDG